MQRTPMGTESPALGIGLPVEENISLCERQVFQPDEQVSFEVRST